MRNIGRPNIALEKEKDECARFYAFVIGARSWQNADYLWYYVMNDPMGSSHRLGFDPARQGIIDVIPQVTRIFPKSARRCDNIIQACAFILFFLSSNSWVAYVRNCFSRPRVMHMIVIILYFRIESE